MGSTEAFTLYLKGRYYWNERKRESNTKAINYFEQALDLDQRCAPWLAGLADCGGLRLDEAPWGVFSKAKEYISRAIELDPQQGEAHSTLAIIYNSYEPI
jgi:tetratricopeptide (TPR) repeat protein